MKKMIDKISLLAIVLVLFIVLVVCCWRGYVTELPAYGLLQAVLIPVMGVLTAKHLKLI